LIHVECVQVHQIKTIRGRYKVPEHQTAGNQLAS